MSGVTILLIAVIVLAGAYLFYGKYLAKKWGIDPKAKTPAYDMEDGVDYVPADTGVVFGHQFASIAGAGPINGPIQAAIFGWVPVLLWILLGGVFFGAVQDFASMYASVKNKGRSIGYIIEVYIGKLGKQLFLLFTWLFSILVVAAFADIVAKTFNGINAETGEKVAANGSVATTSIIFILFAVTLGFFLRYAKQKTWVNTVVAIALLVVAVAIGLELPVYQNTDFWLVFVFIYVIIACVTPVWALLQPRDYLNSFLLIAMMIFAFVGILVYNPSMNLPTFTSFTITSKTGTSYLFPALFVTIACGAVSGFHSLVSSGTASKQIKNEKAMLPVSFGAMLLESFLAVTALIAVGYAATKNGLPTKTPPEVFASAISTFMVKLGLPEKVSYTLITLAISAFGLTSLDSVARVGRIAFQEFFTEDNEKPAAWRKVVTNKYFATILTLALCFALSKVGYASIWPLFGSANQLLSALALIACAVFLKKTKRQGFMLWGPMLIMLGVTFTALVLKIKDLCTALSTAFDSGNVLQLVFAILLLILGVIVAFQGIHKLCQKEAEA